MEIGGRITMCHHDPHIKLKKPKSLKFEITLETPYDPIYQYLKANRNSIEFMIMQKIGPYFDDLLMLLGFIANTKP